VNRQGFERFFLSAVTTDTYGYPAASSVLKLTVVKN